MENENWPRLRGHDTQDGIGSKVLIPAPTTGVTAVTMAILSVLTAAAGAVASIRSEDDTIEYARVNASALAFVTVPLTQRGDLNPGGKNVKLVVEGGAAKVWGKVIGFNYGFKAGLP